MPRTPTAWPLGALPRRMTRELAAYYVGVSPPTFDSRVKDGTYPKPHADGRYDRRALDLAVDRQSGLDTNGTGADDEPMDWGIRELGSGQGKPQRGQHHP
ncbi:hypothetical protein [Roseospira marina]|uniref:hypothetical protein n=1 Tax=Roseospira marina TaxID=140057 RepID=UPI0016147899|nr:hypothetical protein [Roseospira marina]MBB4316117.1 hypothetical protein [Roseospira marina]MBB5089315.1 hypothetical protein [Roseospira marina]